MLCVVAWLQVKTFVWKYMDRHEHQKSCVDMRIQIRRKFAAAYQWYRAIRVYY